MPIETTDYLVIGGGIVGIATARELKRRFSGARVMVIDKEPALGAHASGRNSGVIHAGFYYSADSLKARFTREGNLALTEYCERKQLPLNRCGKLVVAKDAADLPQLDELLRRGERNGVPLDSLSAAEAQRIEPRVRTFERAIFSPSTATADPLAVLEAMRADAESEGVVIRTGVAYVGRSADAIRTSTGEISAGYVVNAAGLYADRVARDWGFSEQYRILPFKGLYLYSEEPAGAFRTNLYPVPDLRNPFLGVHFTVTVGGKAKIGPTAIPAFWREQYDGFRNFRAGEFAEIVAREIGLFAFSGFDFKRLSIEELKKYSRARLVRMAARLAEGVRLDDYRHWGKPGIRAQLVDLRSRKLEMDFILQGDAQSLHVLNAVSPGWTCALPFSRHVVDQIDVRLRAHGSGLTAQGSRLGAGSPPSGALSREP